MFFSRTTPPQSIEAAYQTLTDPTAHNCHPAVIQTNWMFLKEARGQRFYPDRLAVAAHLITAAPGATTRPHPPARAEAPAQVIRLPASIDEARLSALPRIRRAIENLGLTPKGVA